VRIATNVRLFEGGRAIGTRVSQTVRDAVLSAGKTWLNRAFVVQDWYYSGYRPLIDSRGERIGMLYVGFLERRLPKPVTRRSPASSRCLR
jgi:two-component system, NtrC family, sensor kinase